MAEDALFTVGIKVAADVVGFNLAMQQAAGAFASLQRNATVADAELSRFAPRLNTSYASVEQSMRNVQAASDAVTMSQSQLASGGSTLTEYTAATQAFSAAQSDLTMKQAAHTAVLKEQEAATLAAAAAQEKLATTTKGMNMMLAGGVLTAGGLMGVNVMKGWLDDAKQMQDSLTQVGAVARGTQDQLTSLYNQSFTVAGQTQFSAPQILDMERVMAVHGFTDPSGNLTQRQVIGQAIPYFAQAAEIDYRMKGTSYQDSVAALTQQAHQFGAYTGAALQNNVQLATRAGLASGMSPDQQTNVLRYLQPAIHGMHMSSIDAYALAALANQTGLTMNRGGSNLGALFRNIVPGGSKRHQQALDEIQSLGGGSFYNAQGNFAGFANFQRIVAQFEKNAPNDIVRQTDLNNAFLAQGAQAASTLTTKNAKTQYANIVKQLEPYDPIKNPTGYASVQEMQQKLNQTMVGQLNTLTTNMKSISSMLGKELVPAALDVTRVFVGLTKTMMQIGEAAPWLVTVGADLFAIASGLLLLGGPLLLIGGALKIIGGYMTVFSKLAEFIKALTVSETAATAVNDLNTAVKAMTVSTEAAAASEAVAAGGGVAGAAGAATSLARFGTMGEAAAAGLAGASLGSVAVGTAMFTAPAAIYMYAETPGGRKQVRTAVHATDDFISQHTPWGAIEKAFGTGPIVGGVLNDIKEAGYGLFGGRPKATPPHPVQQHIGKVDIHIHPPAGTDAHKIAATTKHVLKSLGDGLDTAANYGATVPFTSNPTLRSAGQ